MVGMCAQGAPAIPPAAKWQRHVVSSAGISVQLPTKPEVETRKSPKGPLQIQRLTNLEFNFAAVTLNADGVVMDTDRMVANVQAGMRDQLTGRGAQVSFGQHVPFSARGMTGVRFKYLWNLRGVEGRGELIALQGKRKFVSLQVDIPANTQSKSDYRAVILDSIK